MTDERRRDRELSDEPQRFAATCEVREVAGGGRRLRFIASTEKVGRDGDIIRAKGWDTKTYMRNPVFLWAHDPSQPPIGRVVKVEKIKGDEPRLEAEVEFAGPEEGHEFADTVYRLYRRGFLKAVSVGFMVRSFEKPSDDERATMGLGPFGIVITAAELLELSAVPVPADPGALKIGKDDRQLRDDLVRMRNASEGHVANCWDDLLADDGQEIIRNGYVHVEGSDGTLNTSSIKTWTYSPHAVTEESMREIVTDALDDAIPRITDSVVRSIQESYELRVAARDSTEPQKPTRQKSEEDLYRLRDAMTDYLNKRKESH